MGCDGELNHRWVAVKKCSAEHHATAFTFMVGLRAYDGVRRPPRYQMKAKSMLFHLVKARGTYSCGFSTFK